MMRTGILLLLGVTLTACGPRVPDSTAPQGVGFGDYEDYRGDQAQRDAALRAGAQPPGGAISDEVLETDGVVTVRNDAPAVSVTGLDDAEGAAGDAGAPLSAIATVTTDNPDISDEQDFDAVASRESIESDAERLAQQAAAREVVEPEALPERSGDVGPNIVAYAISSTNGLGQQVHSRSTLFSESRFQRNCAAYRSPDDAQRDFLARGGPERDPRGLDPDGDGFACGWDPAPFRAAVGN